MNIKKWLSRPNSGFSLLELLVASGIASTVLLVAFGTVGQFYFSQKKLNYSQDFYAESRFLMERIVKATRDNTIDYDRFFAEVGPSDNSCDNSVEYESVFYWDTTGDGKADRNLGGVGTTGNIDNCAQAFYGDLTELYLINSAQTVQTAFKKEGDALKMQVRLGVDTTNDGRADTWEIPTDTTSCLVITPLPLGLKNLPTDKKEEFCARAHDWTTISPKAINILSFSFKASPDRDPFLNFRNDSVQVHPHVILSLETELANAESNGLESDEIPTLLLQTMASSRVFGNIRK